MTTTGTTLFSPDLAEIIEESFERLGGKEVRSGYDFKTARRSLNLLLIEWSNLGINLWTIEEGIIPVYQNTISYDLPNDTVDLLDQVIRTGSGQNQIDININRISVSTYATIPNKNATGRPIQVWVDRQSGATYPVTGTDNPKIHIWPAPDQGSVSSPYYYFVYWRLRRIQDAGNGVNTQDIPFRMLNAMVAGLAYYLSMKLPEVDPNRIPMLKADYEQQLDLADGEDREKASFRWVPRTLYYGH